MWRFPFLIYCVAAWEVGLFEPLLSINLLMFGAAFVLRYRERQALTQKTLPRRVSWAVSYPLMGTSISTRQRPPVGQSRAPSERMVAAIAEAWRKLPAPENSLVLLDR
jgi:hypothetical protein